METDTLAPTMEMSEPGFVIPEDESLAVVVEHTDRLPMQADDQSIHGSLISSFNPSALTISMALPS